MLFDSFVEAETTLLWGAFLIALVMGAVVNKTGFCTMGAVSDRVNIGDTGRMRAWLFAIAVAVLGVAFLEYAGLVDADASFPPYRSGNLLWAEHILGGLLFGVGMTLASGCGNKILVRIGGGNLKSVVVFPIIAVIAYFMINPFPGSDQTLLSLLFYDWIRPLSVEFGESQDLGYLVGVVLGSFLWAVVSRGLRFEWFSSLRNASTHVVGAVLMGFGGTLALGHTFGQAITGVSTLAIGGTPTFVSIPLGSALTMKVQYYRMVYEDEASLGKALVTGLVDLHLPPKRLRRLDAV